MLPSLALAQTFGVGVGTAQVCWAYTAASSRLVGLQGSL